jgi:uncharacterized membrane protein
MLQSLHTVLTTFAALGCGLIAGVFFAFSAFVMKSLGRLPPAQGIAAMQSINIVVINPIFLGVFLGTALACIILGASSVVQWRTPGALLNLAGSLCYLIGTIGVTRGFNIPLNNALAEADPNSDQAVGIWSFYLKRWTAWNHVRTFAALAAAALLTCAAIRQ